VSAASFLCQPNLRAGFRDALILGPVFGLVGLDLARSSLCLSRGRFFTSPLVSLLRRLTLVAFRRLLAFLALKLGA